jgi:O-antigen/teichoic acid export membrane protein
LKKILEKYGVVILYIATIAGLGFSFFGSVLNSKLLSKELFGDWKYIQNFLMMTSFLITFGYYNTGGRLIAKTDDKTRIAIFKGYLLYFTLLGLAIMFCITVFIGVFAQKLLSPSLFSLLLSMFPLFIIHPLMFYFESVFQSERRLISLAIYKIIPPFLYATILFSFKSYSTGNIYFNAILYYVTYFIVFAIFILKDKQIFKIKSKEFNDLRLENSIYGIHLYYGSIWNVGTSYLLPVLIGFFNINNADVGNFSLALSFIIPFSFLPAIVGTSYFKEFVQLEKIPVIAFRKVILTSIIFLIITLLGIDYFIEYFLSSKYYEVGFLVRIGAAAAILHGLGDFINKFLSAKGESIYIKNIAITVGVIQLVSSLIFIKYFSATGAMIAKSMGSVLYFICLFYYYKKKYNKKHGT